jgi:hypothetical protein
MNRQNSLIIFAGVILLFAVGCNYENFDTPTEPSGAEVTGLRILESVSGSGHVTAPEGDFRTFSFSARRYADGSVKGEWVRIRRSSGNAEAKSHGKVSCFTIVGNQAWLGGYATTGLFTTPPDNEVVWRVVDNGEGRNSPPDQISLQFVSSPAGFGDEYCVTTPTVPSLNIVEAGNIQIRP